jgi:hypothetical protein
MNNIREIIRRLVKYILNAFIVAFAANNIFECSTKTKIVYIALISSTMFAFIDMVLPTISIN